MKQFEPLFTSLEQQYKLPSGLLGAVAKTESAGNIRAVSPAGAAGLFQFMPATAKEYGIDPFDPTQAASAAAKKLRGLVDRYQGDTTKALQAYNWGEGNMASGKPMPKETQAYAPKVLSQMKIDPKAVKWDADPIDMKAVKWDSAAPPPKTPDPTEGMSSLDKFRVGIGAGMASIGRNVGQAFGLVDQEEIDRAKQLDAPLMNTTAGKVGNFVGNAAVIAPTALIPGANTYVGATLIGAGTGALTTEGGLKERALGAAAGGAGGIVGKVTGDLVGSGVSKWAASRAEKANAAAAAAGPRIALAREAQKAGYVLPPSDVKPTAINEALNGLSGKIKTAQVASAKNQAVTNRLAAETVGLDPTKPITTDALDAIRSEAGKAYEAAASLGPVRVTADLPGSVNVENYIDPLMGGKQKRVDAAELVRAWKQANHDATGYFRAYARDANPETQAKAKAAAAAAKRIDAAITKAAVDSGKPEIATSLKEARVLIAKTHSVEGALNPATGDIDAAALAKQLKKGKKLSGGLEAAAKVNQAFPRATQTLKEAPKALSPLDYMGGLMTGSLSGNPMLAGAALARPGVRSAILSKPYQATLLNQSFEPGFLGSTFIATGQNELLRRSMPGLLGFSAAHATQQ